MGYYSNFDLTGNKDNINKAIIEKDFYLQESYDDEDMTIYDVKWYDFIKDILEISKDYPTDLIQVYRIGEVNGDQEKIYFKNGEFQRCKGEMVFEKFSPLKMHKEDSLLNK